MLIEQRFKHFRKRLLFVVGCLLMLIGVGAGIGVIQTTVLPDNVAAATQAESINDWMPDINLQKLVVANMNDQGIKTASGQPGTSPDQITQGMMKQLTKIDNDEQRQYDDFDFYKLVLSIKNLDGLKYATNLQKIDVQPGTDASMRWMGTPYTRGQLADISDLVNLDKLTNVQFALGNLTDISALGNKPELTDVGIAYNHISDISPLKTNPKLINDGRHISDGFQVVSLGPVVRINPANVASYMTTMPVKDINGDYLPLKPYVFDPNDDSNLNTMFRNYSSTATGKVLTDNPTQIEWTNITPNSGYLTGIWDNKIPVWAFTGVLVQKYIIDATAAGTVTVHYQDTDGEKIADDVLLTNGTIGDEYSTTQKNIEGYTFKEVQGSATGKYTANPQIVTYIYTKEAADLKYTVKTVDSNGQDLGKGYTASGKIGSVIKTPTIDGYTAKPAQAVLDKDGQIITFVYTKDISGGGTGGGGTTTPTIPATPIKPAAPATPATPITPATPTSPTEPGVVKKGEVVYMVKKAYLYKNATFKKNQRVANYVKKPRINRPMFVVTDYAKSNNGRLRYKVRDVNHVTKNKYRTGYLTTNTKYTRPVYYQSKPKTVTVINPKGVNAHRQRNLTGKV